MYSKTFGMCSTCYKTVSAEITRADNGVFITKECPDHGSETFKVDSDPNIYDGELGAFWTKTIESTALAVTDHCNMRCPMCYHDVSNTQNISILEVLSLAHRAKSKRIILMGAEPTMRPDLTEVIGAIKNELNKDVYIYTNGVKLSDLDYYKELLDSGLNGMCFSMHNRGENNKLTWKSKIRALDNILEMKHRYPDFIVSHISFSIPDLSGLEEAMDNALSMSNLAGHFRIRLPGCAGRYDHATDTTTEYLSVMLSQAKAIADKNGWSWKPRPRGNGAYYKIVSIEDVLFRFIKVPPVNGVDFRQLPLAQKSIYIPMIEESHFVHQVAIEDGIRRGNILPDTVTDWSKYNYRTE